MAARLPCVDRIELVRAHARGAARIVTCDTLKWSWGALIVRQHRGALAMAQAEIDNGVNAAAVRMANNPNEHRHDAPGEIDQMTK
jgi:hypothetical protein